MEFPQIYIGTGVVSAPESALEREWIITNGIGGYASSTIVGTNTRKFHGLLVASLNPPVERWVLLSKLDETVKVGGKTFDLATNIFKGYMPPLSTHQRAFFLDPLPVFQYSVGRLSITKRIVLRFGENIFAALYQVDNPTEDKVGLEISPVVAFRHFYDVNRDVKIKIWQSQLGDSLILGREGLDVKLGVVSDQLVYIKDENWLENLFYPVDHERGEESLDNNFKPGQYSITVNPQSDSRFSLIVCQGSVEADIEKKLRDLNALKILREEVNRRSTLLKSFFSSYPELSPQGWLCWAVLGLDSFLVTRSSTEAKSVIAGYHWFGDWGRDTTISLPGLTLVTGRFEEAKEILITFARNCRGGLIPNFFPDKSGDDPKYNTVDATLWFVNAVLQYLKYTNDLGFVQKNLWDILKSIIEHHVRGTHFGIKVDEEGLITHGPQLTWMDAEVEERPVTSRDGRAVEIQALWYNALRIVEALAHRFGERDLAADYSQLARRAKNTFRKRFWNRDKRYLYDVVCEEHLDPSLRPNQIIAAYLDFRMLKPVEERRVVEIIWDRLWGVYGVRTLDNADPHYIGIYQGDCRRRNEAYHSGTVWPWLLGPFVTSFLRVYGYDDHKRRYAYEHFLRPLFEEEMNRRCLGSVSEIFDGDWPYRSRGCISQAWSLAEPFRTYIEDILLKRPPFEGNFTCQKNTGHRRGETQENR